MVTDWYSVAGFLLVVLPYGMETAFFRYSKKRDGDQNVYATAFRSVLTSTLAFLGLTLIFSQSLADASGYSNFPEYVIWFAFILSFDTIAALPFARLRFENKAVRFASIKLIELGVNIGINLFFLVLCRQAWLQDPNSFFGNLFNPAFGVGYIFVANLAASAVKLLLLSPEFRSLGGQFKKDLWKEMLTYGAPLVLVGLAGIINEMLDRQLLKYMLPFSKEENLAQLGIYGANYKLAVFMNLFIQAFRYAAEPFFFQQSDDKNSKRIYADVLKYFVIAGALVFLTITLFIDQFRFFIGKEYWSGLELVPILLLANLFLGIVVNLSIWYKLTDKTMLGAAVAIGGAMITVILNILWIPTMGIEGSAWATLVCYSSMAVVSYLLSRKYFPVPYQLLRILAYLFLAVLIFMVFNELKDRVEVLVYHISAVVSILCFAVFAFSVEKREWGAWKV